MQFSEFHLYTPPFKWYTRPKFMQKLINLRLLLAVAIIIAICFVAGTITYRLVTKEKVTRTVKKLPANVDVSMEGARLTEEKDGKRLWELATTAAQYDKKRDVTVLQGITTVIFSERAPKRTTITAASGEYDHSRKIMNLRGNVKAISDAPVMTFATDSIQYDTEKKLLTSKNDVAFKDQRISVKGRGLEYSPETGFLRIMTKVQATIGPTAAK